MKTTTLQLPDELFEKAAAKARRLGVSPKRVLRDAIEKDLTDPPKSKPGNALEALSDLIGCIDLGPGKARDHKRLYREGLKKKYASHHR